MRSDHVRGIVMLIAAAFALWKGLHIHHSNQALFAYMLAALALVMAIWHFTRKASRRRL